MTQILEAHRLLSSWSAPSDDQEQLRREYVELLEQRSNATLRDCHPNHLTASALVTSPDGARVVLTLHAKLGRWLQTGGHLETADVDLASAALREAQEESGIGSLSIDPVPVLLSKHEVPCGPQRPAHHLDVQFVAVAANDAQPSCSDESTDVRWFESGQLPSGTDQTVIDLVIAAKKRLAETPQLDHAVDNGAPTA